MVHGGVCALTVGRSTIEALIEIVNIKAIRVFVVLVDGVFIFSFSPSKENAFVLNVYLRFAWKTNEV
jgi:hypothetical protein